VDFKLGLRDAVDAPRVHRSYRPDELIAEWGAFSPDTAEKLRARGHKIVTRMSPLGDANALMIDEWGRRFGWSDGRLGGKALGY
jgi:gamma-glutamyltranspeptidase/glutathione hydrolase